MAKNLALQDDITRSEAAFSADKQYRYSLTRVWNNDLPCMVVLGLNPSTADENFDDPTIRRCIGFAHRENCGSLIMLNIFAYRSTDPANLSTCPDPIGAKNDETILLHCREAAVIIAAWGSHGALKGRGQAVQELLEKTFIDKQVWCFGKNRGGQPVHPLYQAKSAPLRPFTFGFYKCFALRKWEKERQEGLHEGELDLCCHCKMFMNEGDACLEESRLTPMMYMIGKKTKPCQYVDDGSKGKGGIIFTKEVPLTNG